MRFNPIALRPTFYLEYEYKHRNVEECLFFVLNAIYIYIYIVTDKDTDIYI